ncbi:APC family permease [Yinghuangia aomiensis]|uniref:APC family permease n=1 Tax=Yinghuangia aomiensis TaxID=676205 RepID=A0ABP9IDB4_9ACTN
METPETAPRETSSATIAEDELPAAVLHQNVLPWWSMYATSIASVAPSAGLALSVAGVATNAGNGSWLTFVLITVGILGVGYCVSWMARRFTTSGGVYGMGAAIGGNTGGYLQGAPQLLSMLIALPALVFGAGIYLSAFVVKIGAPDNRTLHITCYLAIMAVGLFFASRDVRIASRALLILEGVSVALIVILLGIALLRYHGPFVDHAQLGLHGVTMHGMFLSVAFAMYVMSGFENSATLGKEARNPNRDIPRAVNGTILMVGVLYVISGYVEVLLLPADKLATSAAPLNDIANNADIGWASWIIDLCVAVSFFSCMLAVTNTGARVLYTLSRDRVLPRIFSRVTARHGEPWFAVLLITASTLVTVLIFACMPTPPIEAYAYLGTLGGYFFIGVYLMVIALTLLHAGRNRSLTGLLLGAGVIGTATMVLAMYFSFVPLPEGPYRTVFWIFIALTAVSLAGAAFGAALKPRWWRNIGTQTDGPTLHGH